jgi:hypothetical protein
MLGIYLAKRHMEWKEKILMDLMIIRNSKKNWNLTLMEKCKRKLKMKIDLDFQIIPVIPCMKMKISKRQLN